MNSSMDEYVILVDTRDREIGLMEKMEAHRKGLLHRAFSVFIFNYERKMLLQKRAKNKYHSGGLWTNACCSHPRSGETVEEAALRRMQEEIGITCKIDRFFSFIYNVHLDSELSEHEYDHVFIGFSNRDPELNPEEAEDFRWVTPEEVRIEIKNHPEEFTEWFKICFDELMHHYNKIQNQK